MRTIKLKAWLKPYRRMVYEFNLFQRRDGLHLWLAGEDYSPDTFILFEYAGRHDKSSKKIYEVIGNIWENKEVQMERPKILSEQAEEMREKIAMLVMLFDTKAVDIPAACHYDLTDQILSLISEEVELAIQQAKAELIKELFGWVIKYKARYAKRKEAQWETDPSDIQTQAMLGAKLKAIQGIIDKLRGMQNE
jgi:hypothetical protein